MNLTEILVSIAISAGFASLCFVGAQGPLARQELESASRELWLVPVLVITPRAAAYQMLSLI
ncbi:MAG: hypothetical protein EBZ96_03625 [Synechococcaceae bacterium WB9_3_282]|nr:hypothetical protein [Synechococcaceae bacterium WB9_3_282]